MYEKVFHVLTTKTKPLTIYTFYLLIVKEQLERVVGLGGGGVCFLGLGHDIWQLDLFRSVLGECLFLLLWLGLPKKIEEIVY